MSMPEKDLFQHYAYSTLKEALLGIDRKTAKDVYALSFLITCEDDDLRYPLVEVSYNTAKNARAQLPESDNEQDARWNFAGWLQDMVCMVGGMEDVLWQNFIRASGFWYSDEENERSFTDESTFHQVEEKGIELFSAFIEVLVECAQTLARENVLVQVFGRRIPILLHDLEYSEAAAEWTQDANPPALIADWLKYLDEMGE